MKHKGNNMTMRSSSWMAEVTYRLPCKFQFGENRIQV